MVHLAYGLVAMRFALCNRGSHSKAAIHQSALRNGGRGHGILGEDALKVTSKISLGIGSLLMFLGLPLRDGFFGLIKGVLKVLRLRQSVALEGFAEIR
jgi:hypothetical protein